MRALFGCLAVFLGTVSIVLAARYGYKGADTVIDGVISAVVFGSIALCAFIFDAAAVRLWFMHHRLGSVVIGAISVTALVVTFTNSLGAIAGRADITQAERARTKDDVAVDRAELARITRELDAMKFSPAIEDEVIAARDAVSAAARIRTAECGNGDPKQRGANCRLRETEEQAKRDALATVLSQKAATDRAAQLHMSAAAIRARLAKAPPVQSPNPLGAALELLLGAGAAALTAWQQAIIAGVFELCLVGAMVAYELLGQRTESLAEARPHSAARPSDLQPAAAPIPAPSRSKPVSGSVKTFVRERIAPADGERVEMKVLVQEYRAWCADKSLAPVTLNSFLEEIERVCRMAGIEIDANCGKRVYCLNVRIDQSASAHAIH